MSIQVALNHTTEYVFDRPIQLFPHVVRLKPAAHCRTPILSYSLRVEPDSHFLNWQQDPFGNYLGRLAFPEISDRLKVEVDLVAELVVINPFDFFLDEYAQTYPFSYEDQLAQELAPYLQVRERGERLTSWLKEVDLSEKGTVDFLVEQNVRLQNDIDYSIRMEPGVQTCEDTLDRGIGSCRDTGWLLVQVLRHLGLAARFVSGYLVQLAPDQESLDGPSGPTEDFTDLHAWAEVYIPGAGWIGLDPTSGLFAGEGHIPLACTPDPGSAAPITGTTEPCETSFSFSNTVSRIHEDPRVTLPYSDTQWQAIDALGRQVDQLYDEGDVRLTMGGEPTFVGIDRPDAAEWNTRADGEEKRERADDLVRRLRDAFAPGGLLHSTQGKWYPGEPLPRWQLGVFWRKDGTPIWKSEALVADASKKGKSTVKDAERFAHELTERLGLPVENVLPAYEDAVFFLWEEGNVPVNVDPESADLKDSLERRRLARVLERGLDVPAGYVLPMFNEGHGYISHPWTFRREHLFLIPGESPVGLRLPLDSILEVDLETLDPQPERDLFAPTDDLPSFPQPAQTPEEPELGTVRTALCVEERGGHVYVYMPPLPRIEEYLDLVAIVEEVAGKLAVPVLIEGYEPPKDNRVQSFLVTPDPGILEINIHPSANWEDLVEKTTTVYEAARASRLAAEKFMLDGRHTGTGGGNHVTVGGATPADSPMLRRPDLVRSLVTYWQHHPSLSYLFSGTFIGPTSQAPRVDEGREENLYELEVAFSHMPDGEVGQLWLVDRLLRNMLVDITGNTHRAEFCIDKLYSPDSSSGRQGIVELRAFEMPPHPQMSLVQALLVRALIARFWNEPYRHDLVRWRTELYDRFMLPQFVTQDIREVADDLTRSGLPFDAGWMAPFLEFRFPRYGTVQVAGAELELRAAIEPWHVLGEESTGSGTARYVDSSTERLQVRVTDFNEDRYIVTCNGRRIPLRSTGVRGEHVAGVRYQAWCPPSALHPTMGVHTPLIFDVIDLWNNRSVGGCTYHVGHPGGRNYETLPVNAYEAEGRRFSRFWDYGQTPEPVTPVPVVPVAGRFEATGADPGPVKPAEAEINPEYPLTLDLRRS